MHAIDRAAPPACSARKLCWGGALLRKIICFVAEKFRRAASRGSIVVVPVFRLKALPRISKSRDFRRCAPGSRRLPYHALRRVGFIDCEPRPVSWIHRARPHGLHFLSALREQAVVVCALAVSLSPLSPTCRSMCHMMSKGCWSIPGKRLLSSSFGLSSPPPARAKSTYPARVPLVAPSPCAHL